MIQRNRIKVCFPIQIYSVEKRALDQGMTYDRLNDTFKTFKMSTV